ncbi:MAG: alpha/beta hydrolase [Gemmatimonadetes bacterium]|nr:alpha/beta hydrolase [Gemmatimonadota bacterium]MCY3826982.1 alpha/beta hydrolase [Candidatus Dadabacteria bacterium]MDE0520319.1 alpha/beta hydrolase [Candidatus Dadabacteria bacterium]MDE0663599.1 alpha/beta hydrolase [Candidatus Dadabacteria bacterium]
MTSEIVWEVPEPLSTHDVRMDDETVITLRQHGNPSGPRLVLSHGNGLATDLYYPFWSLLVDDFDLIIYDLRNHGWNPVSDLENHSLPTLAQDNDTILEAVDLHYGAKPRIGVFHSVAALATLLSPKKGGDFAARVLFDPPVCKPGRSFKDYEDIAKRMAKTIRQSTSQFKTTQELVDILPYIPAWQHVVPGVFDLYARTTLRECANGEGYEPRCPPEYQAQLIEYASAFAVLVDFQSLLCPTKVIGADPTLPYSYLPTLDLSDMSTVDYDFLPDTTHLLLLEKPQECVRSMLEFIEPIITT